MQCKIIILALHFFYVLAINYINYLQYSLIKGKLKVGSNYWEKNNFQNIFF